MPEVPVLFGRVQFKLGDGQESTLTLCSYLREAVCARLSLVLSSSVLVYRIEHINKLNVLQCIGLPARLTISFIYSLQAQAIK